MQTELNSIIATNLEASFLITENLNKALNTISKEFGIRIESEYQSQGLLCKYEVNFSTKFSGFWIRKSSWKSVRIGFQFQASDNGLIYGFATVNDPKVFPISTELREQLSLLPNNKNGGSDWWPWFRDFDEPYNDWRKLETWKAISDGRMIELVKEKVKTLIQLIEEKDYNF